MPANATLSAQQLLAISAAFGSLGDAARSILSDDNVVLSSDQSNLVASNMTSLYTFAANVTTLAAKIAFEDSDAAFEAISAATHSGSDSLKAMQAKATQINKMVDVLAAGVNLSIAIGTGNVGSILKNADVLRTAAAL